MGLDRRCDSSKHPYRHRGHADARIPDAGKRRTCARSLAALAAERGPRRSRYRRSARGPGVVLYAHRLPNVHAQCTVMTNRGFAILGDRLYMATLDAHLLALDAKTGSVIWDTAVAD